MSSDKPFLKYSLLFLFVWMLGNFFPGSYNVDTWNQFFEAQDHKYNDWHAPWMAYLWHYLLRFTGRFFSLYFFQMAWYFLFFYHLLKNVTNKLTLAAGLVSSVVMIFIPQYLMKDTHTALAWGTATVILANSALTGSKTFWAKLFSLGFITYGFFIRPNAVPAVVPLLYIWVELYFAQYMPRIRKLAITAVLTLILPVLYYIGTYHFLHTERVFPEYKLRLLDIIGVSKLSGQDYMPACISSFEGYNKAKIDSMYSPATIDHIYWPYDNVLMLPEPDHENNDCVAGAWKQAIKEHPGLYLKNRFEGFLYYLKIKRRLPSLEYKNTSIYVVRHPGIPIDDSHTKMTTRLLGLWTRLDKVRMFDGWFWLLANTVLTAVFVVKYARGKYYLHKILALAQLSAIAFTLGTLLVYQIDVDFRYHYWNVFAFVIGCLYLFRDTILGKKRRDQQTV
ncbi:MAG: hypothetical protein K0R82_2988 [Flavipsychrobacter sp.]|jgi:hypothetical protein|nr:hypothetical protein [Flavipsychrobacter sp.]